VYALTASTTAVNNTASGYASLYANTTGVSNSAVGYAALYNNTTASHNTASGASALQANTTGASNTAVGFTALFANTTAAYNTAVGREALASATTGGQNTASGSKAGAGITTGETNICIGMQAGYYQTNLTTGSQNILLGAYAHTNSASSTASIILGYNVVGSSNTTTIGLGGSDIRTSHGSTSWATVSDERYKKNITPSTAGLSFVNALRPVTWNYKTKGELPSTFNAYKEGSTEVFKNTQTNHGFIAQEVKTAIDADSGIENGFQMWNNTRSDGSQEVAEAALIPVLVKAIQELSTQNAALAARITALEE